MKRIACLALVLLIPIFGAAVAAKPVQITKDVCEAQSAENELLKQQLLRATVNALTFERENALLQKRITELSKSDKN